MIHTEEVQLDQILTFKDETVDDNPLEYRTRRQWTPEEDKILIEKERTRQFCPNFSKIELHYHCG